MLVGEADDPVVGEVDPDHPVVDSRLKRLLDHQAAVFEIRSAALRKLAEADQLDGCATPRFLHEDRRIVAVPLQLDLPDALTAHTALLLEDARAIARKTGGEPLLELGGREVEPRVGTPAHLAGVVENALSRQ